MVDFAVNVRTDPSPTWLTTAVMTACANLAAYPDSEAATRAIAAYHGRSPAETLLTAGAAEAFGLIARSMSPRAATVIHPQFTEPERALRIAGHRVRRHLLPEETGFTLRPEAVAEDADLIVLGNPTNPTGVLHRANDIMALARPGRIVVVDEAFMDAVEGEPESLASRDGLPGLIVVRSLTKTWGLAGLRIGYILAPERLVSSLREQQPPWSVSTPALAAAHACATWPAQDEANERARLIDQWRESLRSALETRGLPCVPASRGPFLLVRVSPTDDGGHLVEALRQRGIAVRRCDTFPGLGRGWIRIAVRPPSWHPTLLSAIDEVLRGAAAGEERRWPGTRG